jgi:hypothetical protein
MGYDGNGMGYDGNGMGYDGNGKTSVPLMRNRTRTQACRLHIAEYKAYGNAPQPKNAKHKERKCGLNHRTRVGR